MLILALTFATSVVFTSCRDDRSGVERAVDDIGDDLEDLGDDLD